jgi:fructosamine-3-kinase
MSEFPDTIDHHRLVDGLHRLQASDGSRLILKLRRSAPPGFFAAEARGLAALSATGTLRVPMVLACCETAISLEDLGHGRPAASDWVRAGRALAVLHGHRYASFGFEHDGWCGDSPQDNTPDQDGHRFFAERRLLPQLRRARSAGLLPSADAQRVERLCARLRDLLPEAAPVLVHGDLWMGNLHACATGELALIDGGAVHRGWAEADLAMLTLFGEPPAGFFAAYEAEAGIGPGWRERAPLFNLYHLLNHLNLFGASYLGAVRAALGRAG